MKKIIQYFDADTIRSLAFGKDLFCLKQSNDRTKIDKIQMCKVSPEEINKLLLDEENMFVAFATENE